MRETEKMMAAQKRRIGSQGAPQKFLLAGAAALFIGLFVLGITWGGKSEGKKTALSANELHHREEALRAQMSECREKEKTLIQSSEHLDEAARDLKDRNKKLDDRNKELYDAHSRQEMEIAKCQEETETQVSLFTEEDEVHKKRINSLKAELAELSQALTDVTGGHGMRTVLLSASLAKYRAAYERLVRALGDPEVYPVSTVAALLVKHAEQVRANTNNDEHRKILDSALLNWTHWRYDAEKHANIFINNVDEDGELIRPKYFDRVGTPPVTVGIHPNTYIPVMSLAEQITQLYDFAVCAIRLNNQNFSYPNTFFWHFRVDSDRTSLSSLVDTPLLTFCEECRYTRNTMEFKLACADELATVGYGGQDFWLARSLIRFYPHVEHEADNFVFANLRSSRYLAVVMHSSSETLEKCNQKFHESPAPHYMYVKGNFDRSVAPLTKDPDLQCAPPWDLVVERIKVVMKEVEEPFDAVYLSIEPESVEHVNREDLPGVNIVIMDQKNAMDEAVDLIVASRANHILVSPFMPQSQVVTEMFLLRKDVHLVPTGNVHFF